MSHVVRPPSLPICKYFEMGIEKWWRRDKSGVYEARWRCNIRLTNSARSTVSETGASRSEALGKAIARFEDEWDIDED